eukprot:gb/GECG01016469.1/.p1 GENE.gb/GECG01016469.1/~~gb/GECG01016469.1/.p1  ORF type:complete len:281 (+),score=46.11 gb/GECG01016469.1/:1-843(+)
MAQSQSVALITGAGTGIGRGLAMSLLAVNVHVFAVGRREAPLNDLKSSARDPSLVSIISADVSKSEGRSKIREAVENSGRKLDYLVHNAGVLGPVKPLMDVTPEELRHHYSINVEGPLFLTQQLLGSLKDGSRILHVSSGAAHKAFPGWGCYCSSKSALYSMYEVLKAEQENKVKTEKSVPRFLIGSVKPGIVDTPMQAEIRATDEQVFPPKQFFENMYENRKSRETKGIDAPPKDALDSAENAGAFLRFLLQDTEEDEYTKEEWDIREEHHHHRWIPKQ